MTKETLDATSALGAFAERVGVTTADALCRPEECDIPVLDMLAALRDTSAKVDAQVRAGATFEERNASKARGYDRLRAILLRSP